MRVQEACKAFLRDLEARGKAASTGESYRCLFRKLQEFARSVGAGSLDEIDKAGVRRWREGWNCAGNTHKRQLAQLKAFFSFARREGWVPASPLDGVSPPRRTYGPPCR